MWQVQVGYPKDKSKIKDPVWAFWIGKPAMFTPEFNTREEAREEAKACTQADEYWNFRVREV